MAASLVFFQGCPLRNNRLSRIYPLIHAPGKVENIGKAILRQDGIANGRPVASLAIDDHLLVFTYLVKMFFKGADKDVLRFSNMPAVEFRCAPEIDHLYTVVRDQLLGFF